MKNYQFKTSLKCSGCVQAITDPLNQLIGVKGWEVDLSSPTKTLSVTLRDEMDPATVQKTLKELGFESEMI